MQLAKRIRYKPLSRQPGTLQITPRQTHTRNVKLPNNTSRQNLKTSIQYVNTIVR
jgi:hypothetical protein